MSTQKLTAAQRDEIARRVKNGACPKRLAAEYGIAWRNVYLLCKRRNIVLPSVMRRDALDAKIVGLRAEGLTYAQIAEEAECCMMRVFVALKRAGVTR